MKWNENLNGAWKSDKFGAPSVGNSLIFLAKSGATKLEQWEDRFQELPMGNSNEQLGNIWDRFLRYRSARIAIGAANSARIVCSREASKSWVVAVAVVVVVIIIAAAADSVSKYIGISLMFAVEWNWDVRSLVPLEYVFWHLSSVRRPRS